MTGAAEAIIDGDLARRIPVRGSDDDLDRLAATFNRMLDRIGALMDSLRQVSNDVAHDLRTPLTRLRQRLETASAQGEPAEHGEALEGALQDVDAILETFAALLRIAQIEGGARRAAFSPLDLTSLALTVVEAFAPSAEDAGQSLRLEAEEGADRRRRFRTTDPDGGQPGRERPAPCWRPGRDRGAHGPDRVRGGAQGRRQRPRRSGM